MEVILLKDVDRLGRMGEIVKVRRGYARNFLIPQGLASVASQAQKRVLDEMVAQERIRDKKRRRQAESLAEEYKDVSCTITVQAGEDDQLFGSVSTRDIAAALTEQGIEVDHHQVDLEEPIKKLGVYSVPVKLHPEVEITVKVWVVTA